MCVCVSPEEETGSSSSPTSQVTLLLEGLPPASSPMYSNHSVCVCVWTHLLSAAMGCDGSLCGSTQRRPVVIEVTGRIHLMLQKERERKKKRESVKELCLSVSGD